MSRRYPLPEGWRRGRDGCYRRKGVSAYVHSLIGGAPFNVWDGEIVTNEFGHPVRFGTVEKAIRFIEGEGPWSLAGSRTARPKEPA